MNDLCKSIQLNTTIYSLDIYDVKGEIQNIFNMLKCRSKPSKIVGPFSTWSSERSFSKGVLPRSAILVHEVRLRQRDGHLRQGRHVLRQKRRPHALQRQARTRRDGF